MSERSRTRSRMFDDQMAVVLGKFGDDDPCDQEEEGAQSTLLDQYERLSFEVHLKQAMLGRSLSEPSSSAVARTRASGSGAASWAAQKGKQGGAAAGPRKSRIHKVVKMLIKPLLVGTSRVFVRKDGVRSSTPVVQGKDHRKYLWRAAFSRSMRGV